MKMKDRYMKTASIAAAAFALAAQSAALAATPSATANLAGAPGSEVVIAGQHVMLVTHGPAQYTPPLAHRRNLPSIYNDFATSYPKGLYNAFTGLPISGPHTIHGQYWFAAAFTPTANATVQEIDVAAASIAGNRDIVQIHLYADASGIPGTELWSGHATLPVFGTCCAIATLHDKAGVPLTAGTQYWLGVTTLPHGTVFQGAWDINVLDQVDSNLIAINTGNGWAAQQSVPNVAFGLYGK
jgi:hypothetical protein